MNLFFYFYLFIYLLICWFFHLLFIYLLFFFFAHVTHKTDYLPHSKFCFYLIDFQLNTDFPSQICIFQSKITQCYKKISFSRKCFSKEQNSISFSLQNFRLLKFFYSHWKQFQVFQIAKFEFKVNRKKTYIITYGQNVPSCDLLNNVR